MKMFLRATVAVIAIPLTIVTITNCSSSSGGGSATLTTAGKMTTGINSSVTTIQGVGGALGTGTFFVPNSLDAGRTVNTLSAATKCTTNAEPGDDANHDGVVEDSEKYSSSHQNFALQSFYCAMAANSDGPEAVSGAVSTIKTVVCAMEKQIGSLTFNTTPTDVSVSSVIIDLSCASQSDIDDMTGTTGQTSVTLPVAATITTTLNPTFAEAPSNTHYSHGIRIASNDGTSLKFVLMAKFDPSLPGDPIENGDFEFATYGTGSFMQGTAVEYTAGKISGSGATKHLWYEFRANRFKSTTNDALCESDSGSCGWGRHVRLSTDIAFSNGDISGLSNLSGIISDGSDSVGSGGMSNSTRVITAKGGLTTGVVGKIWTSNTSAKTFTGALSSMTAGSTTCAAAGSPVTTSCSGLTAYEPSGTIDAFIRPPNTSTWYSNASIKGGLGFTGDATLADGQFTNP